MKRVLTIVAAILMLAAPASAQNLYGWTISSSSTDALVNSGGPINGVLPLFLWFYCAPNDGMTAFEGQLSMPAGVSNFGFTPQNGFLNAGDANRLLLAVGGCPHGPVVAGSWTFFAAVATTGSFCMVPADLTGNLVTVDCSPLALLWPITQRGFGAGTTAPCTEDLCIVTSVEDTSWGAVKSLYR